MLIFSLERPTPSVDRLANRGRRYWCHQFFLIFFGDGLIPKVSVGKLGMELGVWFLVNKTNSSADVALQVLRWSEPIRSFIGTDRQFYMCR